MPDRTCRYCGEPLKPRQKVMCGKTECRRKHLQHNNSGLATKANAERRAVAKAAADLAVTEEVHNQVAEVVREELTQAVLESIGKAVKLLPKAIEALANIIESDETDPDQKRQAATTLLRYTMGNQSVAPPSVEEEKAPLQVHFNIPGGELPKHEVTAEVTSDAEDEGELHECVECHLWKPWPEQFASQSDRCQACDAGLRRRLEEQYGKISLG
jgi:hypothetical protein